MWGVPPGVPPFHAHTHTHGSHGERGNSCGAAFPRGKRGFLRKLRVFSPPPHMSSHPGFFAFVYFSSRIARFLCFFCETGDDSGRHSTLPPITLRPPYLWLLLEDYEVLVKMKMGTGDISLSPDHTSVSLFVQHATAPGRWRKNERIIRFFSVGGIHSPPSPTYTPTGHGLIQNVQKTIDNSSRIRMV